LSNIFLRTDQGVEKTGESDIQAGAVRGESMEERTDSYFNFDAQLKRLPFEGLRLGGGKADQRFLTELRLALCSLTNALQPVAVRKLFPQRAARRNSNEIARSNHAFFAHSRIPKTSDMPTVRDTLDAPQERAPLNRRALSLVRLLRRGDAATLPLPAADERSPLRRLPCA
jgi:hypothetical protein